jgi:hypothetical protein
VTAPERHADDWDDGRFYLLSPATSYAGEYIWQGDAKTGCQKILKDTGVAKDEWQMGTTKAFIKNPETVSLLPPSSTPYVLCADCGMLHDSYSLSNICAINTGRTWLVEFNELGETIFGTRTNVRLEFNVSGGVRKIKSSWFNYATTVIKYSRVGRRGEDSV